MLHLIVAVGSNGAIGRDNDLPWHLPADLRRFKKLTMGHALIMGRKTFESLPGMLPGRPHIVLTRDEEWAAAHPEVQCYPDLENLLATLKKEEEYFIIGGGQIYRALLPHADILHITEVDLAPEADIFFPEIDPEIWECVEDIPGIADEKNIPHRYKTYHRRNYHSDSE